MSHHPSLHDPKWDHPAGDHPSTVYPVPPRLFGQTQLLKLKPSRGDSGYGSQPHTWLWKLRLTLWLINLSVISYCVYYLWPCPPLAIFGITLHP